MSRVRAHYRLRAASLARFAGVTVFLVALASRLFAANGDAAREPSTHDVVIYGGTAAGVAAALINYSKVPAG